MNIHIGKRGWPQYLMVAVAVVLLGGGGTQRVLATTATSPNYQLSETEFGATSSQQSCSGQYCARASIGDLSTGSAASGAYSAQFGSITDSEPLLEVIVEPGKSDLGTLTTEKTATKTMKVRIRNYLSDGYTLQLVGASPKYGDHTLKTSSTPVASAAGTEQFGINVVANTLPAVGADPQQVPSDKVSFGVATESYRTPNVFKYVSGDVVARSKSQSGQTDYTISMIVNVSNVTPAGHYAGDFSAIVVPTF